ncbi:hypothetical protein AB205_0211620 [Aquarana catesbeiana]|uniref:Uncharacterized protein n=1 Tax=Aquarana catesbeiana TaxID=8400 RepID=A0A2G9SIJ0_AQUCT|nr:hypothetical protein AB205_0211620 [Aquarana catesbeiana]
MPLGARLILQALLDLVSGRVYPFGAARLAGRLTKVTCTRLQRQLAKRLLYRSQCKSPEVAPTILQEPLSKS